MAWRLDYLYRGTTPNWPGSPGTQELRLTPTTTDPIVATLVAIECRNYGEGLILIAPRAPLQGLLGPHNHFGREECEVSIRVSPLEFFQFVIHTVDVDVSLKVLGAMGFVNLPIRINGPDALRDEILETQAASYRLNLEQIEEYNRRIFGISPP